MHDGLEDEELEVEQDKGALEAVAGVTLVGSNAWGLPRSSAETFDMLALHGVIEPKEVGVYRSMIGFRNISVHDYTRLDPAIVQSIVGEPLGELEELAKTIARLTVAGETQS